jgi:hypothetical protein
MQGKMQISTPLSESLRRLNTYEVSTQLDCSRTFNAAGWVQMINRHLELLGCTAGKPSVPTNHCQVHMYLTTREAASIGVFYSFGISLQIWSSDQSLWLMVPNFAKWSAGINQSLKEVEDLVNGQILQFLDAVATFCPPPRDAV